MDTRNHSSNETVTADGELPLRQQKMRKQDLITLEALEARFDKPLVEVVSWRRTDGENSSARSLARPFQAKEFDVCLTYMKKMVSDMSCIMRFYTSDRPVKPQNRPKGHNFGCRETLLGLHISQKYLFAVSQPRNQAMAIS